MKKKKLKKLLREAQQELAQLKIDLSQGWVHLTGSAVDSLRFFDEPLSAEQIKAHYQQLAANEGIYSPGLPEVMFFEKKQPQESGE